MSRTARPTPPTRYVYVIGPEHGLQKVGLAINPRARLAQLQTASPQDLLLHTSVAVPFDLAPAVERKAHRMLIRTCVRNEWFDASPAQAVVAVQDAAQAVLAKATSAAPRRSWRLGKPLCAAWSPPDLGPLRRALAEYRQPDRVSTAGPLFCYKHAVARPIRMATSFSLGTPKLSPMRASGVPPKAETQGEGL